MTPLREPDYATLAMELSYWLGSHNTLALLLSAPQKALQREERAADPQRDEWHAITADTTQMVGAIRTLADAKPPFDGICFDTLDRASQLRTITGYIKDQQLDAIAKEFARPPRSGPSLEDRIEQAKLFLALRDARVAMSSFWMKCRDDISSMLSHGGAATMLFSDRSTIEYLRDILVDTMDNLRRYPETGTNFLTLVNGTPKYARIYTALAQLRDKFQNTPPHNHNAAGTLFNATEDFYRQVTPALLNLAKCRDIESQFIDPETRYR